MKLLDLLLVVHIAQVELVRQLDCWSGTLAMESSATGGAANGGTAIATRDQNAGARAAMRGETETMQLSGWRYRNESRDVHLSGIKKCISARSSGSCTTSASMSSKYNFHRHRLPPRRPLRTFHVVLQGRPGDKHLRRSVKRAQRLVKLAFRVLQAMRLAECSGMIRYIRRAIGKKHRNAPRRPRVPTT